MTWDPKQPPRPIGEWYEYSAGTDYRGYTLDCGRLFHVHIVSKGGRYDISFNGASLSDAKSLRAARFAAEAKIVAQVREMLPAYRIIFARYEQQEKPANVTPLRPIKD